ncbi:MAG TPA: hypothetical protein VGB55_16140 [Tepidisphaeraceae bacterium]
MGILLILISVVSLACWIYTLVRLFQAGKTLEGILSICPLVGFIIGWVRARELDHTKVMLIWTVAIILNLILNFAVGSQAQPVLPGPVSG